MGKLSVETWERRRSLSLGQLMLISNIVAWHIKEKAKEEYKNPKIITTHGECSWKHIHKHIVLKNDEDEEVLYIMVQLFHRKDRAEVVFCGWSGQEVFEWEVYGDNMKIVQKLNDLVDDSIHIDKNQSWQVIPVEPKMLLKRKKRKNRKQRRKGISRKTGIDEFLEL